MGYSMEVIKRARDRLAQARADRESENLHHQQVAYDQVPRLREIDRELRKTMSQATLAVFAGGGDVQAALEQVKQQNLGLQQERQALIEENFEPGYLDDAPICDRCGGTGYLGSNMCECLAELCRQEQKKELTFLSAGQERFDQFRLDYYPDRMDPNLGVNIRTVMDKNFKTCKRYAQTFSEKSPNLLFSGDTGLGKTFLSACIARTVADSGFSVVYESAGHLFAKLEKAKFEPSAETRREAAKYGVCDLLIIDDLGTELVSQFTLAAMYELINDRLLEHKPTIISTNLTVEELSHKYTPQIVSRLRGSYLRLPFLGDDIRVKKNWGL